MKTDNKNQMGVVVEAYNHDALHRILVVRSQEAKNHYFFYVPTTPQVDFGDHIQMNFVEDKYYIRRGNSKLTYKITLLTFPASLLWELITERMNL